jgi:hypothetical protein
MMKLKNLKVFVKGLIVVGAAFAMAACDDVTKPAPIEAADDLVQEDLGEGGQIEGGQGQVGDNGATEESGNSSNSSFGESSSSEATVLESSSSDATGVESSSSEEPAVPKIFLANDTEEEKNFMSVEYKTGTGADGEGILAYPTHMTSNPNQKHAVVIWGPGGGTAPGAYEGIIRRLASHGFVVLALSSSPGDGSKAIAAMNWLDEQNKNAASPLFGKLDMNTVGCSGHSMGGLESERALIKDERVLTAFLNNSGAWDNPGANQVPANKSIAILYGEGGMERGNAENDYNRPDVSAPACLIEMTGGTGTECYDVTPWQKECGWGHGSGSWGGMAATISWMRWHLGGEDWRKADFVGMNGKYINGPIIGESGNWKGTCKNFN